MRRAQGSKQKSGHSPKFVYLLLLLIRQTSSCTHEGNKTKPVTFFISQIVTDIISCDNWWNYSRLPNVG